MSNEINDGGPAFPFEVTGRLMPDGGWLQTYESGMSLRDYFAGQAMGSIAGHVMGTIMARLEGEVPPTSELKQELANLPPIIAPLAYALADGMLVARNFATPAKL